MTEILLSLYGAIMALWLGHASKWKKYFPQPWPQIALAIPFAYVTPLSWGQPLCFWIAGLVLIATTAAWLTGWGNVYDLGRAERGKEPEKIEYPILWLHGRIPEYLYDFIGLSLRGIIITATAGIACMNPVLALSGAVMAPCYAIGWAVQDWSVAHDLTERRISWNGTETYLAIKFMPRHLDGATEIGRTLSGLAIYGALGILTTV